MYRTVGFSTPVINRPFGVTEFIFSLQTISPVFTVSRNNIFKVLFLDVCVCEAD